MVIWGAVWGFLLGALLSDSGDTEFAALLGLALGALAGWALRLAVRNEVQRQQARLVATPLSASSQSRSPQTPSPQAQPIAQRPATADAFGVVAATVTVPGPFQPQAEPRPVAPTAAPRGPVPLPRAKVDEPVQAEDAVFGFVANGINAARTWLLGGNTIVRAGVVVLFIGLVFLAKYAVENAMLPPELRLAGIGLLGVGLLLGGFRLRNRQPDKSGYALTLQGAGVAVLYLTVFAAFRLYDLLNPGVAFVLMALVCALSTAIALLQRALPMAMVGFGGGFAVPLLLSTGQGSHVGLFTYYLVLNLAILAVTWWRAWRPLNLLGFFATFGVATVWGALKYQSDLFASTEPFLLAFFGVYVAITLLYATRHDLPQTRALDGTLLFGTPLVAFGLQAALVKPFEFGAAFSALAVGGFYLALAFWALARAKRVQGSASTVSQWLAEGCIALGLGFVTLAVPLALDAGWTSAVWAAEGAGVYWLGRRQGRWLPRAVGLALQGLAAISFLNSLGGAVTPWLPLANRGFVGAVVLAASSLVLAHWTRLIAVDRAPIEGKGMSATLGRAFEAIERHFAPVLFWVGFLWVQFALVHEISRPVQDASGNWVPVLAPTLQSNLGMLGWLISAYVAHRYALPSRAKPWAVAATPAWFVLPMMLLVALNGATELEHIFQAGGWLVWPVALVLHALMLRHLDDGKPQALWQWVHAGGVWLVVLLGGNLLLWAVRAAQLQGTAWSSVIVLVASIVVMLCLSAQRWMDADRSARQHWPLDRFARAYLWHAAAPLAVLVGVSALWVACSSNGNARPLPYLPLLNPTDISVALALGGASLWFSRVRLSALALPASAFHPRWPLVLAGAGFVAINTVWLRAAHQLAGVPWQAGVLFDSFLVQAGYSILWTLLALGLMVLAHRMARRALWMGGGGLLALTVLKLFTLDLANRGGSERIVVFIAVGLLMLVVGYFAPIPPAQAADDAVTDTVSDTQAGAPGQTSVSPKEATS